MIKRLLATGLTLFCLTAAAEAPTTPAYRAQIHTELAAAYFNRGQLGVALEELGEAVKADSGYAPAYNMLGLVYMELQEDSQAEDNFRKALSLDSANSDANNNFDWFLCQRGRAAESIRHFMAALKNPLYTAPEKSYVNAGICTLRQGDAAGAEGYFFKALKLQPQNPLALFHLADLNFKRGDYAAANGFLTKLLRGGDGNPELLWLAVRTARKLGDKDAERDYSLRLRRNFPDSKESRSLRDGRYE